MPKFYVYGGQDAYAVYRTEVEADDAKTALKEVQDSPSSYRWTSTGDTTEFDDFTVFTEDGAVVPAEPVMSQQEVIDALNVAAANGYDMSKHTPDDIVADLLAFEVMAENDTAENLLPHVNAWLAQLKSSS